jgi:N-methylhydantoinase A
VRYQGQGYELRIPWRRSPELLNDFHKAHKRRFGYQHAGKRIELVTLRVRGSLGQGQGNHAKFDVAGRPQSATTSAQVSFAGKSLKTGVVERSSLTPGFSVLGPLIVAEYTATTVIPPGWRLRVHRSGALLIESQPTSKRRSN